MEGWGTDLHTFSWGLGDSGGHRSGQSGGRGRWRGEGTDLHTFSWGLGTAGAIGAAGLEGGGGGGD